MRVLLVDGNDNDVSLIEAMLYKAQYSDLQLTRVGSLSEALGALDENLFNIVLTELSLPDSHGFGTFACLQEQASDLPIIVLSNNEDEGLAARAIKHGAQDYLIKGHFNDDSLVRAIRHSIERQRITVEMQSAWGGEQHLAYHDVLTNLPNRLLFCDRLSQALAHAKRYNGLLAVLFLDLDDFKKIINTLGHSAAEKLLQMLATRLRSNIRASDTIARVGGDEFSILLKGIKSVDDLARTAQKISQLIAEPFLVDETTVRLTCSLGASLFPHDGNSVETLIKKADFAMYRVKARNKNDCQLFNTAMGAETGQRISLENSLRQALADNELRVHFQPQVSLKTGEISGVEALIRWKHPKLGLIPPAEFVPIAEDTGLIVPLGEWILRAACMQNRMMQVAGYPPIPVAINLSARQFREISLPEVIEDILQDTGLAPEYLVIEITESNAMQDLTYTVSLLEVLKEMGVGIALDDFGTGYSSLSYLKRLPIDLLKIDKVFVRDLPANADDAAIISAIIALAKNMHMRVVAEGVESASQVQFLQQTECDFMQGFFFSKPLPPSALLELLDTVHRVPVREVNELETYAESGE